MRAFSGEAGLIAEAQGSARFQYGETVAQAAVYGPSQPRYSRHEEFDRAVLEVNYSLATPPASSTEIGSNASSTELARIERDGARQIKQVLGSCVDLKSCPRMLILIDVSVLRSDGATLSTALNASVLALLDSGIPMLYVPMSLSLSCCVAAGGTETAVGLLETSADSESTVKSNITFAFRQVSSAPQDETEKYAVIATMATGLFDTATLELGWAEVEANASTLRSFFSKVVRL